MKRSISGELVLKPGMGDRLRTARTAVGLKQRDLSEIGGIARATQVSYETEATEPSCEYLRAIAPAGLDTLFILFALSSHEIDSYAAKPDWDRIRQAHDDVAFFCQHVAPLCPDSYRWKLVEELYAATSPSNEGEALSRQESAMSLLSTIWARCAPT